MVSIKIDTRQFDATLRKYAELSKRDAATIVNTKAFYIARAASRETFRPSKEKIKAELEAIIKTTKAGKGGKTRKVLAKNSDGAPIAALLINWKRGKLGKPGLFGAAMKDAVKKFIQKRQQARAYMASGWNPAIKALAPLAEKPGSAAPRDGDALKHKGRGGVQVAVSGFKAVSRIINEAFARQSTTKDPDIKIAKPALERAFAHETKSMMTYIEGKMRQSAQSLGIRTR